MKSIKVIAVAVVVIISARVVRAGNCQWIAAPTNLNFGNYSVFSPGPLTANSAFTVMCTPNQTLTLKLNDGANSASYTPRSMKVGAPGTALLNYNLYTDAGLTQIWGDGTGGTTYYEQYNSSPGNKNFSDLIYGQLPAAADAPAGTYQDIITATLTSTGGSTLTQTFTVSATVVAECTVSSFGINFGAYDPIVANAAAPLNSTTVLSVYCTKSTTGAIALDLGSNVSAGVRRMKNAGGAFLNYNIYTDSGYGTVWNTVNTRSATSSSRFTPLNGGFTAYGQIAGGQDAAVGAYSDTVVATVNY
jgi:spore coat protein U-like protein